MTLTNTMVNEVLKELSSKITEEDVVCIYWTRPVLVKSTFLRSLNLLEKWKGQITVNGYEI